MSAVAKALGMGWALDNVQAISTIGTMVYDQPGHFDRVRVLGVDEAQVEARPWRRQQLVRRPCWWTSPRWWMAPARPACWT